MKTKLFIPLIAITFIAVSCQKSNDDIIEEVNLNTVAENNNVRIPCGGEENMFERQLHWFSYVTAKVLDEDTDARNEVLTELTGVNAPNTIDAADLIGANATLSDFEDAFETIFLGIIDYSGPDPDTDSTQPTPPPVPDPFSTNTPEQTLAQFIEEIVDNNCVELYFPVALNFSGLGAYELTSTAHPLTSSSCNEAIKRFSVVQDPNGTPYTTIGVTITDYYVSTNENIIVARPYRELPNCRYTEYSGIDFEDFLD